MVDQSPLSIAFLEQRPQAAAETLAAMPPSDAAAFLNAVPTRFATKPLAHMGAWPAAEVIANMQDVPAGAVLRELAQSDAIAILRRLSNDDRQRLMKGLPSRTKRDLELLLSFGDDEVGSVMMTDLVVMGMTATVADTANRFRRSRRSETETVFVVDEAKALVGAVKAAELLRQPARTALSAIVDTGIPALAVRTPLESVRSLAAWDRYVELPAVAGRRQLVGAVSVRAVRGDARLALSRSDASQATITASIVGAYVASAVGLAQLMTEVPVVSDPAGRRGGPA